MKVLSFLSLNLVLLLTLYHSLFSLSLQTILPKKLSYKTFYGDTPATANSPDFEEKHKNTMAHPNYLGLVKDAKSALKNENAEAVEEWLRFDNIKNCIVKDVSLPLKQRYPNAEEVWEDGFRIGMIRSQHRGPLKPPSKELFQPFLEEQSVNQKRLKVPMAKGGIRHSSPLDLMRMDENLQKKWDDLTKGKTLQEAYDVLHTLFLQDAKFLSVLMTLKLAAIDADKVGGGKGLIYCVKLIPQDNGSYKIIEGNPFANKDLLCTIEGLYGEFLAGMDGEESIIGPYRDVPAPDMATNGTTMANILEAYIKKLLATNNNPFGIHLPKEIFDLLKKVYDRLQESESDSCESHLSRLANKNYVNTSERKESRAMGSFDYQKYNTNFEEFYKSLSSDDKIYSEVKTFYEEKEKSESTLLDGENSGTFFLSAVLAYRRCFSDLDISFQNLRKNKKLLESHDLSRYTEAEVTKALKILSTELNIMERKLHAIPNKLLQLSKALGVEGNPFKESLDFLKAKEAEISAYRKLLNANIKPHEQSLGELSPIEKELKDRLVKRSNEIAEEYLRILRDIDILTYLKEGDS